MKCCTPSSSSSFFFFVPNNRSEMITWRIDKVSASAEICDREGWLELNCSAWTHATATDVMWVSDKSLHFRGRASSFEYADIWRKGSEMKLDEMSDTALTFGSQMLTQWEPTPALAGRHMWKQLTSFCWCWQSLPASMRKTLENFFFFLSISYNRRFAWLNDENTIASFYGSI